MLIQLFSIAFSLFLIIDPIGNIPIFATTLKRYGLKRQRAIILREQCIALFIMVAFEFLGDIILQWLHIDIPTVQVSGGIILFMIALGMIFPGIQTASVHYSEEEPFIVPLAVPLVSGPTILAAIMVYTRQTPNHLLMLGSIFTAWFFASIILLSAPVLTKLLKQRGLIACERLMGLILTFMSIQMFLEGLYQFSSNLH